MFKIFVFSKLSSWVIEQKNRRITICLSYSENWQRYTILKLDHGMTLVALDAENSVCINYNV